MYKCLEAAMHALQPAPTVSPKFVRPATKKTAPVPESVPGEAAPAASAKVPDSQQS